jgi:hypothetical protein
MENPAGWNQAVNVITKVIHEDNLERASAEIVCGYSLPTKIALALEEAGYLTDGAREIVGVL